jgi:hypothetical protein
VHRHPVDAQLLLGPVLAIHRHLFHLVKGVHAVDHLPKDSVLAVEVAVGLVGEEKLAAVAVGAAVGQEGRAMQRRRQVFSSLQQQQQQQQQWSLYCTGCVPVGHGENAALAVL